MKDGYDDRHPPPPEGRIRWVLRLLGWNALLLLVGVVLIAIAGEAYLRLTIPFMKSSRLLEFVPNVGLLWPPNTELRFTNRLDFWNVSRTNSLGFLDREPPSSERAAATCHISMIGDSFVEAGQVPIDDKFHVRLEELAADGLPHLDVTTSAFGILHTGQVQQLPLYDEYARLLHPKLIVLVFVENDFADNTPVLRALRTVDRRQNILEIMVGRRSDGKLELAWSRPRDQLPETLNNCPVRPERSVAKSKDALFHREVAPRSGIDQRFLPSSPRPQASWAAYAMNCAMKKADALSWLARWLLAKKKALSPADREHLFVRKVEALRRQPGYAALLEGWRPTRMGDTFVGFTRRDMPPFLEDALQYTRFALEQFKDRADRDGAKLVILASHTVTSHGTPMFERLSQMAATLDIPVIDQADYILRQGARLTDARWPHDFHWNPAGHRWAAEALLEYLEEHPATCDGPT